MCILNKFHLTRSLLIGIQSFDWLSGRHMMDDLEKAALVQTETL